MDCESADEVRRNVIGCSVCEVYFNCTRISSIFLEIIYEYKIKVK